MEQIKEIFRGGPPEGTIYDILKAEHRQVRASLNEIVNAGRITMDTFNSTIAALDLHMKGEEQLFYSRLERYPNTRMIALKAREEHNLARMEVSDIRNAPQDERWLAKVMVLYDTLNHHIDVEENDMFPTARRVMNDSEAMELGRTYRTQTLGQAAQQQTQQPQPQQQQQQQQTPPPSTGTA